LPRPAFLLTQVIAAAAMAATVSAQEPAQEPTPRDRPVIQTLGRRVTVAGGVLALTEPDENRVALFDVSGTRPRKIGAFGRRGFRPGELHAPHGAVVAGDRLYVSDTFNHRIQVFDVAGLADGRPPRVVYAFGDRGSAIGDLRAPHAAIAISSDAALRDRLYVTDSRNDRIQVFDRSGRPTGMVMGGKGAAEGQIDGPAGAAFDPRGRVLYVAETGNRRVSAFDAKSGAFLFAFARDLRSAAGIAVDGAGIILVADPAAGLVRRYAPVRERGVPAGARTLAAWGRTGTGPGEWRSPSSIAADRQGRVYVTDLADDRGQIFTADGAYVGSFGEDMEPAPMPAPRPIALTRTLCSNGGGYGLDVVSVPRPIPMGELFDIEVVVREGCRSGATAGKIVLEADAVMPGHGHGMNTHPRISPLGEGRFLVSGLRLHMPGRWELHFDILRDGVTERAQVGMAVD
jgi:DNA-binding beta-propeller fold protein YncE